MSWLYDLWMQILTLYVRSSGFERNGGIGPSPSDRIRDFMEWIKL